MELLSVSVLVYFFFLWSRGWYSTIQSPVASARKVICQRVFYLGEMSDCDAAYRLANGSINKVYGVTSFTQMFFEEGPIILYPPSLSLSLSLAIRGTFTFLVADHLQLLILSI